MGLGGTGGREELARENLELKASGTKLQLVATWHLWKILFGCLYLSAQKYKSCNKKGATQNYEIH